MLPNLDKLIIGLHHSYVFANSKQTPFDVVYSLSVLKYASQQATQPLWDMEQTNSETAWGGGHPFRFSHI